MESLFKQYKGVFDEKIEDQKPKAPFTFAYSPFALQDAIGMRDIKNMWLEYRKLRSNDIEAEEIIHNIISKLKDMVSISNGATQDDLGLKDFPFNKSKRDLKNWKIDDLKNFYTKFVFAYHHSRMGRGMNDFEKKNTGDLDTTIETIILSL